jgi:hypothetical protein
MTDYLFARPSVLEGIGRNIDLFGVMNDYNTSKNGAEADLKAMENDLAVLKKDFDAAFGHVISGLPIQER